MKTCFYQLEVIDVDSLTEWCGRSEVTIDDIKQGVGYLEITDGHTKVNLLNKIFWLAGQDLLQSFMLKRYWKLCLYHRLDNFSYEL